MCLKTCIKTYFENIKYIINYTLTKCGLSKKVHSHMNVLKNANVTLRYLIMKKKVFSNVSLKNDLFLIF